MRRMILNASVACLFGLLLTGCATSGPGNAAVSGVGNRAVPGNAARTTTTTTNATVQHAATTVPASKWPVVTVSTSGHKLPVGVQGSTLAANAGNVFAVGGYTGAVSLTDVTEIWPNVAHHATLPMRMHDAAAGYIDGNLYVFGGGQNDSYNTIIRIRDNRAAVVGTLKSALSDAVCVPWTQNGQAGVLLIGGYDGRNFHRSVEFFAIKSGRLTSNTVFTLPVGLRYPAVAVSDGTLVIAGGRTPTGALSSDVYAWSQSNGVRRIARLPYGIEKAGLFGVGANVVLVGGLRASGQAISDIRAIHLTDGTSQSVAKLPKPLYDMGYVQYGTTGFIAGGVSQAGVSADVYELHLH